ncbi:MAG: 4-hydroxy-tetrahydrodipicolinate synthase [Bacteroidia bacterium]|nr:4-hydroxy-tetrahydrodipicolinate synthase [Bacteroidia bacterium]MDW8300911.1 4-hydroxy-tetrahydrodipicolinate synthase [Bacteroidia bacterium]
MNTAFIKGTGVALVTPFTADNQIDTKAIQRLVFRMIEGGVEYLVPMGTTGESPTLTKEEKKQIIETVLEANQGKLPVVMGIGGNDTRQVIQEVEYYTKNYKLDGILSVCPYYNKPNQNGIYAHYAAIAQSTDLPIIMYNIPPRTGINMNPETILRLANDFKNLVAVKEAAGSVHQVMHIIAQKPASFLVTSGDDNLTLPFVSVGAIGVISVAANVFPREVSQKVRFALQGDYDKAREYHYKLLRFMEFLFAEGNPVGVKAALEIMGICLKNVRLPLVPASEKYYQEMGHILKEVNDNFGIG